MLYQFDVTLSDKDYLDYNIFWMIKSPYGRKQMLKFRLLIVTIFVVLALISLVSGDFAPQAFLTLIPYAIMLLLVQLLFNSIFILTLKAQMKALKKQGKMGYTPTATIAFFEDKFVESAATNTTEQAYTAIERISVMENRAIYIHVNNVMSYILPFSCFASDEEREALLAFLKTKCGTVDLY